MKKLWGKIKKLWGKFKNFYKKCYKKNKVLTIILTIIITPIVLFLLFCVGIVVLTLAFVLLVLFIMFFGFGKKSSSNSSNSSHNKPDSETYLDYSEKEIYKMIDTEPKLKMAKYEWYTLAEALDESKYTKEIKVKYAKDIPIYIFPRDEKPRMIFHLFKDSEVTSGGGFFEKEKKHFTVDDFKKGYICIIHDGKRLTPRDM